MRSGRQPADPGIGLALRRIALGYRVVGALWLCLLATIALSAGEAQPLPAVATMALALGWSALTLALAGRPRVLRSWAWLASDVGVAATTILLPALAATAGREPDLREATAYFGGYPFSAVVLAAYTNWMAGGLAAGALLAATTVGRLGLVVDGPLPARDLIETAVFYLASGAILAWGNRVLVRTDAQRRAAEAALADERAQRIRSQERAETAAVLHDSVLQTLALIQRRSGDPAQVSTLARRQERDLRDWLFDAAAPEGGAPGGRFADALRRAAGDIEDLHGLSVELVAVGDADLDDDLSALVAASREALANVAKHAGVDRVSLYAEVGGRAASVFVRDRGAGFDPTAVRGDRRGIAESIVGRLERHGGRAEVRSAPGEGTEVEMVLPRRHSVP
ncbi:MAG TPA: ATP-binding protein [Egibacteraceae bacterium]|nr:ATP-binding protein [Egibacteraceae bacterium]